jgi:hypothetical protein
MPEVKKYGHGRIAKLAEQLEAANITPRIAEKILEGGETIVKATKPKEKADWLWEAMVRMDDLLDMETRKAVREGCACCLGGKRLKISQGIARNNATLEDRIKAANNEPFVFGHSVTKLANGDIRACFFPEGLEQYRCVCLPQADKPLPVTYCYCCGGHVKHHLQIALGRKLDCTTVHTALSSGGKKPCTFTFKILE